MIKTDGPQFLLFLILFFFIIIILKVVALHTCKNYCCF